MKLIHRHNTEVCVCVHAEFYNGMEVLAVLQKGLVLHSSVLIKEVCSMNDGASACFCGCLGCQWELLYL
jgi:hypothetical protein